MSLVCLTDVVLKSCDMEGYVQFGKVIDSRSLIQSFLSVRLLIWKPVACLKSATFLRNCGYVAIASFLGVPSSYEP
jgi:hypothetical protein